MANCNQLISNLNGDLQGYKILLRTYEEEIIKLRKTVVEERSLRVDIQQKYLRTLAFNFVSVDPNEADAIEYEEGNNSEATNARNGKKIDEINSENGLISDNCVSSTTPHKRLKKALNKSRSNIVTTTGTITTTNADTVTNRNRNIAHLQSNSIFSLFRPRRRCAPKSLIDPCLPTSKPKRLAKKKRKQNY